LISGKYHLLNDRFLFTLMGFFAFYCGFIYNDFFSIPLNLFGTCWDKAHDSNLGVLQENCVVWFGMDPSWYNNKAIIGIWPQMN
jgi:V-type H+-transporting ATPase subunit a